MTCRLALCLFVLVWGFWRCLWLVLLFLRGPDSRCLFRLRCYAGFHWILVIPGGRLCLSYADLYVMLDW